MSRSHGEFDSSIATGPGDFVKAFCFEQLRNVQNFIKNLQSILILRKI